MPWWEILFLVALAVALCLCMVDLFGGPDDR